MLVEKFDVYLKQKTADKLRRMAEPFGVRTDRLIALLCDGLFDNPGYAPAPQEGSQIQKDEKHGEQKTDTRKNNSTEPCARCAPNCHCRV
jgi:hypothetical protein